MSKESSRIVGLIIVLIILVSLSKFRTKSENTIEKASVPIAGKYKGGNIVYTLYDDHSFGKDIEVYNAVDFSNGGTWSGDYSDLSLLFTHGASNGKTLKATLQGAYLVINDDPDVIGNYLRQ